MRRAERERLAQQEDTASRPSPPPPEVIENENLEEADPNQLHGTIEIEAGSTFEVPIMGYPGCVLTWQFSSSGGDVGFSIDAAYYDSTTTPLVGFSRVKANEKSIVGMLRLTTRGLIHIKFDNAYSYFHAKTVKYSLILEEPLGGEEGPVEDAGVVPEVFFVLGGPGAGKRTACEGLAKEFGFFHASLGELLQQETSRVNSKHAKLINRCTSESTSVPAEIIVSLLYRAIRESSRKKVLVNGFPRNVADDWRAWEALVGPKVKVGGVLSFDISNDDILLQRLQDDKLMRNRLAEFHSDTQPVLDFFRTQNLVHHIDASLDKPQVFSGVKTELAKMCQNGLPSKHDYVLAQHGLVSIPVQTEKQLSSRLFVQADALPNALATQLLHQRPEVLVLHYVPDFQEIEVTLEACDVLFRQGTFSELGVSQFPAWQVVNIFHICASRGWLRPSICFGTYSVLERDAEFELLPALKMLKIRFHAMSDSINPSEVLSQVCGQFGMTVVEANLNWLCFHSKLTPTDVVEGNTNIIDNRRPLPIQLAVVLFQAWQREKTKGGRYFF